MPPSLSSNSNCMTSVLSKSKLSALLSQHQTSQVVSDTPSCQLKSFFIPHNSSRGKEQIIISDSDDDGVLFPCFGFALFSLLAAVATDTAGT